MTFTAWIIRKDDDGVRATLEEHDEALLEDLDTTVRVRFSGINYKDALALQGKPGVVRTHPLIPGIDLAGEVVASSNPRWNPGDEVVLTGAGAGEEHHGGLSQLARANGDDLVAVPSGWTAKQAAALGTAGFTAALSVLALQRMDLTPDRGPVLVTGAGGGVGSVAVALLAGLGHEVHAVTGRVDELGDQLRALGATQVLSREDVDSGGRPLAKQRWAGLVDAVGGAPLASALAQLHQDGVATTCGLAAGAAFPGNVMPFILRGVSLLGIDSVRCSPERRAEAWQLVERALDVEKLDAITHAVPLARVQEVAVEVLAGRGTGRTVVEIPA